MQKEKPKTVWRTVYTKDETRPGAVSPLKNLGYTQKQIESLREAGWKIVEGKA